MSKVSIIIPCYNEAERLKKDPFLQLLYSQADVQLLMVNDGSTDKTGLLLEEIRKASPQKVKVISYTKNLGKSFAVFKGMQEALHNNSQFIGYLDADLSTGIEEFLQLAQKAEQEKADYIFGSRVKMLNHVINRSTLRHVCGRILTTLIDSRYRLGIYDTQCGAKMFTAEIIRLITGEPFKTSWLFDVEIFLRIREAGKTAKGLEIPLKNWTDPGHSKISLLSFPRVSAELLQLIKHYKRTK
jgi:dolichyl-phosphate beta-glucosyltransferase